MNAVAVSINRVVGNCKSRIGHALRGDSHNGYMYADCVGGVAVCPRSVGYNRISAYFASYGVEVGKCFRSGSCKGISLYDNVFVKFI